MMMVGVDEINTCFEQNGWVSNKKLSEFDAKYLSEDLAQFEKNGFVVDFGFYGDGVEPVDGEFRIYLIEDGDWVNVKGTVQITSKTLALRVLENLATLEI